MNPDRATPSGLPAWKHGAAWLVLLLESLARAFWRTGGWVALWIGLILIDIPSFFGSYGPLLAGIVFYTGLAGLILSGFLNFRLPSQRDVLRRMEMENDLLHRPLSGWTDRLATLPDSNAESLWAESRRRALQEINKARLFPPAPVTTHQDPFALRHGALLVFAAGLTVAGGRASSLIEQALLPFRNDPSATDALAEQPPILWIKPPDYTGLPTVSVSGSRLPDGAPPLSLPQGASIKIRIPGGWAPALFPAPVFSMGGVDRPLPPMDSDTYGGTFQAQPPKESATPDLTIRRFGLTLAHFAYAYIPDEPPVLTRKANPEILPQAQIRFTLTTKDDYGARDLTMSLTPDPKAGDMPLGEPLSETRPVMSPPKTETELRPVYDLSAHPWAGLPVLMSFTVTDALGQTATTGPVSLTLPERTFRHPVANRLVALRKKLAWAPLAAREEASREIEEILSRPGLYGGDTVVFLGLRSAASRLFYTDDVKSAREVMDILWNIALRLEDGNLSLATRDLRSARDALERALRDPQTTDEQLADLNDQLRQALATYFSELGKELQKRMAEGQGVPSLPPDMMADVLDGNALSRFLDRLNSESLSGNREKAMEMLSRLQKMTDALGTATIAPMPKDLQAMAEGVSELQELVRKQESLRDQTMEQARHQNESPDLEWPDLLPPRNPDGSGPQMGQMPPAPNAPSAPPPSSTAQNTRANKAEQEALRRILGTIMQEVGEASGTVPDNLGKAELSMRNSAQALGDNDPGRSVPYQDDALKHLRDGAQGMASALSEKLSKMTGLSMGGGGFDPLGRPRKDPDRPSGLLDDEDVRVPTDAEKRRVDTLLKTLRDRAADPSRSETELDYLHRLLKQF